MNRFCITVFASLFAALPAFAAGDVAAGEQVFRKCKACHAIADDAGNVIQKGGKTGPNLYGIVGKSAASVEGYKYSKSMVAAGEAGLVWDEEHFVAYVQNPSKFLKEYLDDSKAKSKMTLKLRKGMEDIYAYLLSIGPDSGS